MAMSTTTKVVLSLAGVAVVVGLALVFIIGGWFVSIMNAEAGQANLITNKITANKTEFDNMWKKNTESFQITEAQKEAVYKIVVGNANARAQQGKGSLAAMVTEAVPNVDKTSDMFEKLMNVVIASRNEWTRRQVELVDMKRVHDNMIDLFPSSLVCSILGRKKIEIQIVTSERTAVAFATGQDNQVGFGQNATPSTPSVEKK
jgi:hypothetical protein